MGNYNILTQVGINLYNELSPRIKDLIKNDNNIFLIGKDLKDPSSLRAKIYDSLFKYSDVYRDTNIYFPELIFEDQIYQRQFDLLSLENLLAKSVDSVVMCIESPGSFTELGAFANNELLNNKLIVFLDKKYEKDNSFINLGPIKYLKKHTDSKVVWFDFTKNFDKEDLKKLRKNMHDLKKNISNNFNYDLSNPIYFERYMIALLYCYGKIDRKYIIEVLKAVEDSSDVESRIRNIDPVLNTLLQRREIHYRDNRYFLNTLGTDKLRKEYPKSFIYNVLDIYRIQVLNLTLRSRKYWVWKTS